MICPNKNSPEWKKAVELWGEAAAYNMFLLGIEPTTELNIESSGELEAIQTEIEMAVRRSPDYYRQKYKTFLSRFKSDFTVEDMIDVFTARAMSLGTVLEDGKIKTKEGYASLFPESEVDHVTVTTIPDDLNKELTRLFKRTGIPFKVINDPNANFKGRYINDGENKIVLINLAKVSRTTPLHEYLHPFVRLMLNNNPELFSTVLEEAARAGVQRESNEETVVQYLAEKAAKKEDSSLIKRFFHWLANFFRDLTGKKINDFSSASTVDDVLRLFYSNKVDLTKENTLLMADDFAEQIREAVKKMREHMASGNASAKKVTADPSGRDYVQALAELFAGKYSTSDTESFYLDEKGNKVAIRLTVLIGDREYGEFSTKFKGFTQSREEFAARKHALQYGIDTGTTPVDEFTELIPVEGSAKPVTLRHLVELYAKMHANQRNYGKMIHAYIQMQLESDPVLKAAATELVVKYMNELDNSTTFTKEDIGKNAQLKAFQEVLPDLLKVANIRVDLEGDTAKNNPLYMDRVLPETIVVSDLLTDSKGNKIGSTIDGMIQKWTGQVSLVDWKTGEITSDMDSTILMQYGEKLGVADTKVNRAYLEMAFRAMMLKEHFPEMRFDDIMVVKVSKHGKHRAMKVDLQQFLTLIGTYYKETNMDVYKEIEKRGMLDATNYFGVDKSFALMAEKYEVLQYLPKPDAIVFLKAKLASLRAGRTNDELKEEPWLVREISNVTAALQEIEKLPGTDLAHASADIALGGDLKNLSEISHPRVQVLHKSILEAKQATTRAYNEFEREFDTLHKNLLIEQGGLQNKTLIENAFKTGILASALTGSLPALAVTVASYYVLKRVLRKRTKEVYGFLWKESKGKGKGYFLNLSNEGLTPAQIKFRDFIKKSMGDQYAKVVQQVASADIKNPEKSKQKWEIMGLPPTLTEDFMPRAPKTLMEVADDLEGFERYFNVVGRVKYWFAKNITNYFEQFDYGENKDPIPFKYLSREDSGIVTGGQHSFNPEIAVKGFMMNLLYKEHHDSLYNYAKGLELLLEAEKNEKGELRYKGLASYLSKQIDLQILQRPEKARITSREWPIKLPEAVATKMGVKPGTYNINQDKVLRSGKYVISYSMMAFKSLSALKNFAMITIVNSMNSTKNVMNRIMGIPPEEFAPGVKETTLALADLGRYFFDSSIGKEDNKLALLAKQFDWLPDNYPYSVNKGVMQSEWASGNPLSYAFLFHGIGETYGAMWHLGTLLRSMKFKDKDGNLYNAYDAYEVQDGKLVWTKGSRGVIRDSDGGERELTELDTLEIKNLKRQNELISGSYRQEERSAIEHSVFGEYFMQFKRFWVTFMKNLYILSPYKDITLGRYKENMKRPDGVTVWEWEQEINQARIAVVFRSMMLLTSQGLKTAIGMKQSAEADRIAREQFQTASNKFGGKYNIYSRQKQTATLLNTAVWLGVLFLAFANFIDDDDDVEEYGEKFARRIIWDSSMGLFFTDALEGIKTPIASAGRFADIGKAFLDFTFDGVVRGKRTREGNLPGTTTILRSTPGVGSIMQWHDLYKEVPSSAAFEFIGIRD